MTFKVSTVVKMCSNKLPSSRNTSRHQAPAFSAFMQALTADSLYHLKDKDLLNSRLLCEVQWVKIAGRAVYSTEGDFRRKSRLPEAKKGYMKGKFLEIGDEGGDERTRRVVMQGGEA